MKDGAMWLLKTRRKMVHSSDTLLIRSPVSGSVVGTPPIKLTSYVHSSDKLFLYLSPPSAMSLISVSSHDYLQVAIRYLVST